KNLPIIVYLAAVNTKKSQMEKMPDEIIAHYFYQYPEDELDVGFKQYDKLNFFDYIFRLEMRKKFPLSPRSVSTTDVLEDMPLIANMASSYYSRVMSASDAENQQVSDQKTDTVKRNSPQEEHAIIAHLTTDICFCRVPCVGNDQDKSNSYQNILPDNYFSSREAWNIYQIGLNFREKHLHKLLNSETMQAVTECFETQYAQKIKGAAYKIQLDQQQFETLLCEYQKKNQDDLLSAVYTANILHNAKYTDPTEIEPAYQGAPCMLYLLGMEGKSYNVFGDCVADVLCSEGYAGDQFTEKRGKIKTICPDYSAERACEQAMSLIDDVFDVFLEYIITICFKYSWCMCKINNNLIVDSLILIGDRVNVLQQYASRKKTSIKKLLLQKLQNPQYVNELFEKMQTISDEPSPDEQLSKEVFEKDIQTKVIPVIEKMLIVPEEEFIDLMYQSVRRFVYINK
ncbi:MAG: hypothetical protein OXC48_08375, partial [Endozoicomonadaceae bacterium]|nr:hypothetical protein [Endozoicomonadaceae bacterium]